MKKHHVALFLLVSLTSSLAEAGRVWIKDKIVVGNWEITYRDRILSLGTEGTKFKLDEKGEIHPNPFGFGQSVFPLAASFDGPEMTLYSGATVFMAAPEEEGDELEGKVQYDQNTSLGGRFRSFGVGSYNTRDSLHGPMISIRWYKNYFSVSTNLTNDTYLFGDRELLSLEKEESKSEAGKRSLSRSNSDEDLFRGLEGVLANEDLDGIETEKELVRLDIRVNLRPESFREFETHFASIGKGEPLKFTREEYQSRQNLAEEKLLSEVCPQGGDNGVYKQVLRFDGTRLHLKAESLSFRSGVFRNVDREVSL